MVVAESLGDGASSAGEPLVPLLSRERVAHALPRGLRQQAESFAFGMLGLLFPHFATPDQAADGVAGEISPLRSLLEQALSGPVAPSDDHAATADRVFSRLASIREGVLLDARAIYDGDPAAHSLDEVIVAYPGFIAIAVHRIAHELYPEAPLFARLLTEVAHSATGIDIHPGARIGPSFAIDHGTGIVIGETAVLGECAALSGCHPRSRAGEQGLAICQAPSHDRR